MYFTLPNNKARLSILKTLIDTGLEASQVARSFGGSHHGRFHGEKKHPSGNGERPKSAGAQQQHISSVRSSFKSNSNSLLVESSRSITPELPPIPSISRSSVLRDLKSFTRRKSGNTSTKLANQNHPNNSTSFVVPKQLPQSSKQPVPTQPKLQQQQQKKKTIQHRPSFQRNEVTTDEKEGNEYIKKRECKEILNIQYR
ncbi:hypothetical protein HPULCUR_004479 [Helicostylum pulchrum]|uniref:Uncharacterized protein n=1 Tax=Helicostylum pulchrum TaxID=562976 RepID=A0ABP9XXL8_9FUNG